MKKNTVKASDFQKASYIAPQCVVIKVEKLQFICISIRPKKDASGQDDYDENDSEIDGGEGGIDF